MHTTTKIKKKTKYKRTAADAADCKLDIHPVGKQKPKLGIGVDGKLLSDEISSLETITSQII